VMAVVLVVDDHPGVAAAVAGLMQACGHEAAVAHSGRAGLEFIRSRPVDLAVLDVSIPDMSGLDVLRAVRGDPKLRVLPVVMFSANDLGRDEALRLGAVGFVLKSDPDGLEALVEKHAGGVRHEVA